MKRIFIVGGNGFAREIYLHLKKIIEINPEIQFGGFLGHNGYGKEVDYKRYQKYYIGDVSEHEFKDNDYAIIGAGYPSLRKKIYEDLKKRQIKFYTLVPPEVKLNCDVEYGEANIFIPPFEPSIDCEFGIGNVFNGHVIVGHDVSIGNFNFFGVDNRLSQEH